MERIPSERTWKHSTEGWHLSWALRWKEDLEVETAGSCVPCNWFLGFLERWPGAHGRGFPR